jgi:tetratricopeptide (TPR) repeat protein
MHKGKARFIAIANGIYYTLSPLTRAEPDANELAEVLRTKHQFEPEVLPSLERGALLDEIDKHLGKDALSEGTLIVIWIGHGEIGANHSLRLIGRSKVDDVEVASAGELGEWAARTGAQQVLVVIDTCFSGGGVVDAVRLAEAVNSGRASPEKVWFGVLAACLGDEPARSGALVRELTRILSEGPQKADFRWDPSRPFICGDDLVKAVCDDFSEPRQKPYPIKLGISWDFVCNPCYTPGLPDQPVEHLLHAARGGSGEASYFTGRKNAIEQIVNWMRCAEPGLFVLTGPPGCGKSAVIGRIVSLSSSAERARLLAGTQIPVELDPGEASVDGQLHARGVTVDTASEMIAQQLGLDADGGLHVIIAEAERRSKKGDPLIVVVDGLDEALGFSRDLAVEFLAPLARRALVLVGTRDVLCGEKTLIQQLGPVDQILDLGEDVEGTLQDIRLYVKQRLDGVATTMDPELVAEELTSGGDSEAPQFLLARLLTSQLRDHPVDTSSDGWQLKLATTVESALERDLQSVVLTIDGKSHPTAAREMILALAFSHGGGFPADDVWPAVATAVSPTRTAYTRDHAYAVLAAFGRHIIAGSEGDQPVYRIAHRRLEDYVVGAASVAAGSEIPPETAVAVGTAIFGEYEKLLDAGLGPRAHSYLWRHAWRHLVQADPSGLHGLRRLVERDPEAFRPKMAAGLELASSMAMFDGHNERALEQIKEAIGLRRELEDGLKLAMALFQLAYTQASVGDLSGAEKTSAEAAEAARAAADRPESRYVLMAVLVARAHTQILGGHYRAAQLLAKEALALNEGDGETDEKISLPLQVAAYNVMARSAMALEDFEKATVMCQEAVDLIDRWDMADEVKGLCNETLSTLASVQLQNAVRSQPDGSGRYGPTVKTAAQRVLDDYLQKGKQGTIADISVSNGILCYVRSHMLDMARGVGEIDAQELHSLLNEAIKLVSPFADQLMEAAVILADGVSLMPFLPAKPDPDRAILLFANAKRCIRPFSDASDLAAVAFGQLLNAENVAGMQIVQGDAAGLPPGAVARQKEAVALLRRSSSWFARNLFAQATSQLCGLLIRAGQAGADEDTAIRAEAIEAWRDLVGKAPEAPVNLVGLLCDQAGVLLDHSAGEAADLAREAVDLAESLPQPHFTGLLGVAKTNLAGAQLLLGSGPETRTLLQQAIEHLEPLVPHPVFSGGLANACLNLALLELNDGKPSDALLLAERALSQFDTPKLPDVTRKNRPKALIALGRAQRGSGQEALGIATLNEAIGKLCAAAIDDGRSLPVLANALNTAAPELWDKVLAKFADHPDLQNALKLMKWPSAGQVQLTVASFLDAFEKMSEAEHRFLRQIARWQRSRVPEEFDAAWQEATGEIPNWLHLDPDHEWLVIAWYNTRDWRLSRDYLKSHQALLKEDSDLVLEEFGLEGFEKEILAIHRDLLNAAREIGVDAAYASWIAWDEIIEWMQSEDPEQHLAEHEELFRPEISELLQEGAAEGDTEAVVFAAILDLARRGESQLAFQAARDANSTFDHLQAAWRSTDITRLASIASIMREKTDDPDLKRSATVALAVARQLEGRTEDTDPLIETALEESTALDIEKMSAIIGDAITHHPTAAAELASLISKIAD